MPRLSIYLLGSFRARFEETDRSVSFRTEKERALLAFLAVESDRAHTRDSLAEMFWPDRPEGIARTNLRQALAGIRRAIGDRDSERPYLLVTDETIRFNLARPLWIDTAAFSSLLQGVNAHEHVAIYTCFSCISQLREAVDLYRGDFAGEFALPKSREFLEWAAFYREHFFRQYMVALEHLSDYHLFKEEYEDAYALAWKLNHLAPLEEKAHRRLMRILALNRRRSAAIEQYHTCKRILWEELGVGPSPETDRLFEQIRDGGSLALELPVEKPLPPPIPLPLTPFFGREKELDWLSRCLPNPVCRLMTLVGMPGVGKTRLALQAACSYDGEFPGGVYFAPLEAQGKPAPLIPALAQALGQRENTRESILRTLAARKTLLVIDGFENHLSETAFLLDLLQHAPELKILLTSRQKLNYQAACFLRIEGLAYPEQAGEAAAEESPSVRLFAARAERMQAGFKATPETLPAVVAICRLVRGNPLALELAAARIREFELGRIVASLETGLDLLETTQKDVPIRHRSMPAAIAPSWERLEGDDQTRFSRLAGFPGRFGAEAARAVAGVTLPQLTSLVDQSLLDGDASAGFELHPLLRHFAAAKLAQDPAEFARVLEAARQPQVFTRSLDRAGKGLGEPGLNLAAASLKDATRDPLTRLPNRLIFEDRLDHALTVAAREGRPLAVMVVDFQTDPAGEEVNAGPGLARRLPGIALQIRRAIRESDTLARIGERSFGLVLHTLQEPEDAARVAGKIFREIDRFYRLTGSTGQIPVRMGISLYPQGGADGPSLLNAAWEACNQAREGDDEPFRLAAARKGKR